MDTETEAPKLCKTGGHLIPERDMWHGSFRVDDDGNQVGETTYQCHKHWLRERSAEFVKSRVLHTRLINDATLEQYDRKRLYGLRHDQPYSPGTPLAWFDTFCDDLAAVHAEAKLWERAVWFGGTEPDRDDTLTEDDQYGFRNYKEGVKPKAGLQAFVDAAEYKGYKAKVGDVEYLSYTMCGRSIFQIDAPDDVSVGIILDEDSPSARGGIKSISATRDQAIALIRQAISDWQAGKIKLEHGEGVGFGF